MHDLVFACVEVPYPDTPAGSPLSYVSKNALWRQVACTYYGGMHVLWWHAHIMVTCTCYGDMHILPPSPAFRVAVIKVSNMPPRANNKA